MMAAAYTPARRCLACNAIEPIGSNELVWPPGGRCPACGAIVEQSGGIPMFAPKLADTVSGFDPNSFDRLATVESEHFWFVARNELIVGLANRYFPNARRFLEIGCGNGAVLRAISTSRNWERLVGSDLHPAGLAHAQARMPMKVEFVQMDARAIPAVETFDLTGAFDVVEHIAEDDMVLQNLRRATCPGGGTIIAVPQHMWLWSRSDDIAHHQRRYERRQIERKLEDSGFEVLFSSSYTATLLPLMAASRLKSQKENNSDIDREFNISRRVNSLFTSILRAEVRLTLQGFRWPAGGSRIVVARAV
jgi:SAM-dependent methyltransferase